MFMRGESVRFWLPIGLLACMGAYSSYRLIDAHISPEVKAPDYTFTRDLKANRGSIYSSFGKSYPFAKSVPYWEYHLDPVSLTNALVRRRGEPRRPALAIMKTIADALGVDFAAVKRMSANTKNRYQFLALSSDPDAYRTIADSSLVAGVAINDKQVRQYIHGRRLCHVLGSVNDANVGSAGIEQYFNRELTGTPGKIKGMRDARRRELYDKRITSVDPIPGADIYLTIDPNIQFETERHLKWGVAEYGAGAGWGMVMNAKTGAILSMASYPDFEPIKFGKSDPGATMNRTIAWNYEPGSVMKVITAAAAIDMGRVTPSTRYRTNRDDDRYFRLPGDGSHKWEPTMTVKDAIVHSSNIVIGKLGYDIGPKRLWEYMRKFGFGAKTHIELPGEQYGILPHWKRWDKVKWSRAPIGQGVSVTAIQLISAYQALANDGVRMKPYIVEKVVDANGLSIGDYGSKTLGSVVSASTARKMREMMLGVAAPGGTARRAAIKGYSIAGKTGTAQKVINGHYADGLYVATFCGIVPATAPELVILISLDFNARTRYHQGGNSAGPVFKRLALTALRYLEVAPDKPEEIEESDDDEYESIKSSALNLP